MNRKKLTIGLFGFGCVGSGLHQVLRRTPTLETRIKTICVKNPNKDRSLPSEYFTYDKNVILEDPEINVVVELIDDAEAAFEIVSAALRKGKAVVTGNKKMIAEHLHELLELQSEFNTPLLYEAACCASIPIIRNLEEYYDNDLLESIEGIVNGSTNYILTKSYDEGTSYESALIDAQKRGFAESNPVLDTGGFDAKFKLIILIAHAFGLVLKPNDVFNLGIDRLGELEFRYAKEKGLKIKLIAHAQKNSDGYIEAFVIPKFIDASDKIFNVDDVFNGVKTKSFFSDEQFFTGKGAGSYPTASAVLSDISALTYDYKYEYKKLNRTEQLCAEDKIVLKVLLRHRRQDITIIEKHFIQIEESYVNVDNGYIIGNLSLESLKRLTADESLVVSAVLIESIQERYALPFEEEEGIEVMGL